MKVIARNTTRFYNQTNYKKMVNNFRGLFEEGYVSLAKLPQKNDFLLSKLNELDGYTVPMISHDYSAKTPEMWNTLYEKFGLNIRNIMVVANPDNAKKVMSVLREDPKYLGKLSTKIMKPLFFGIGFWK